MSSQMRYTQQLPYSIRQNITPARGLKQLLKGAKKKIGNVFARYLFSTQKKKRTKVEEVVSLYHPATNKIKKNYTRSTKPCHPSSPIHEKANQ